MTVSDAGDGRSFEPRGDVARPVGLLWVVLLIAGSAPLFAFGLESLAEAWSTPEYSHGPLIPLLSSYLFLRELAMIPPADRPQTDRWKGVLVIALALAIAALGNVTRIPDIVAYGLIVWVLGVILTVFGFRRGLFFWPAVLHLVFMLPLPQFIYWQLTVQLQFISSEIGVALVRAAGVPVFLDGNVIDLGTYQLLVAEACSGLRYLFPIMSFSYIFCVLYRGPWWHKGILLLSAAPLAVLMNSFRIGVIGVLVDNYGIEQAEGFLHFFEGWVIFGACVAILFLLARTLMWIAGDKRPLSVALDLEFTDIGRQLRKAREIVPSKALMVAAVGAALASAAWAFAPTGGAQPISRDSFDYFPRTLGVWQGRSRTLDRGIEKVLAADDYYSASYAAPGVAAPVDFFIAYYLKQTEGGGIHSPEVCIPGGGWEMFEIKRTEVTLPAETGVAPFSLNRAIIQHGEAQQLVYYWFEERGRKVTNDYLAKVLTVYDSIALGRTDGALVRLITPIGRGEAEGAADERLRALLAEVMPILPDFVPDAGQP